MEQIPAAIIGLGRIASLLENDPRREKPCTHAGAIAANSGCRLVAGADADEGRRVLFAEKWNVPVYADAEAMIAAHKPLLLVIATHPDSHARYCRLAAAHRIPVTVCEKPLADTLGKARQIARLAAQGGEWLAAGKDGARGMDGGREGRRAGGAQNRYQPRTALFGGLYFGKGRS
jgi:predicted dehydrogenase